MTESSVHTAINLRLALLDLPRPDHGLPDEAAALVAPLLARQRELSRRLSNRLCPVDGRIQAFVDDYLAGTDAAPELPRRTLVLDQPGLARELSLPVDSDAFSSDLLSSYRLVNGVLHNPANDRRTTAGVFHVAEGGLPIPDDKRAVPREVFGRLLERAFQPPESAMTLPYTSQAERPASCFASLLLRPLVVPQVPGFIDEKRMEIRFIVPGGLVANLDFVEGIFGNGGDPYLPENDSSLDPAGWTGHTGLVVLAPHLTAVTKKDLGLPHRDQATERQRRDGMCWESEDERYNGGQAFKVCARDARGVIVTVIADNYFGYCKKEVKTQISYSANLSGYVEEEHAGGARVYASHNQGQEFTDFTSGGAYHLQDVVDRNPERFVAQPEGHALDLEQDHLVLVPAGATFRLADQSISWEGPQGRSAITLRADKTYLGPDGYSVRMAQVDPGQSEWSLVGTYAESTVCHKPSTVSGGGKSEISKAITDAVIYGNAYVADYESDMRRLAEILHGDYANRFADPARRGVDHRRILGTDRSVGSVIKLLTPSADYTPEYNSWLEAIPPHVKELVFVVKRYYKKEWGEDWRSHFTVGIMNGRTGNALRLDGQRILVHMLRVGFDAEGAWRLFGLRHDFHPAAKVQTEDDISASVVTPAWATGGAATTSRKYVENCERLLFQRPDDAIHRGYDKQAELDIATTGTFLSNFQPLNTDDARAMEQDAIGLSQFTAPMQDLIRAMAARPAGQSPAYFVSSANPRLVDGKPSKNPRYLQVRPDLTHPRETATAELASHLVRRLPAQAPAPIPVDVVAAGRRNNPPEPGAPALCAFNPLHYLELPELFMEFISSMTGKSPSTTGAGSEGAMTKGPFNALPAVYDLNAAFLSYALTGYDGWVSCAGYVGPKVRVDHDISMLVPEVFSRMTPAERDAGALIEGGYLERVADTEMDGRRVLGSRLGYRMTKRFASTYFGRIFMHPHVVFTDDMLRPELQDPGVFADSVDTIVTTHRRVAQAYIDDGTIEFACPPLRALLEIMATGTTADGRGLDDPTLRAMFTRDAVLSSEWYGARVDAQQAEDVRRAQAGIDALTDFIGKEHNARAVERIALRDRLAAAQAELARVSTPEYRESLVGTLGRQVGL